MKISILTIVLMLVTSVTLFIDFANALVDAINESERECIPENEKKARK